MDEIIFFNICIYIYWRNIMEESATKSCTLALYPPLIEDIVQGNWYINDIYWTNIAFALPSDWFMFLLEHKNMFSFRWCTSISLFSTYYLSRLWFFKKSDIICLTLPRLVLFSFVHQCNNVSTPEFTLDSWYKKGLV